MPFTHVVSFTWNDQTTPEDVGRATAALTALVATLGGVQSYRCGADCGFSPNTYAYAIVGVFTTREDFLAYRDHPEHQRISKELIVPHVADRVVVQLED